MRLPVIGLVLYDAATLSRAVRDWPALSNAQRQAWRMLVEGGITVDTPPDNPVIRTTFQLDGDVLTFVSDGVFGPPAGGGVPRDLDGLAKQHLAVLRGALEPLAHVGQAGRAVLALIRTAHATYLALLAALQACLIYDAWVPALLHRAEVALVSVAGQLGLVAAFYAARRIAAWGVRHLVRARLGALVEEQRAGTRAWRPAQ